MSNEYCYHSSHKMVENVFVIQRDDIQLLEAIDTMPYEVRLNILVIAIRNFNSYHHLNPGVDLINYTSLQVRAAQACSRKMLCTLQSTSNKRVSPQAYKIDFHLVLSSKNPAVILWFATPSLCSAEARTCSSILWTCRLSTCRIK